LFLLIKIAHPLGLLADPPALNENAAGVMRLRPGSNGIILRQKAAGLEGACGFPDR
jgi:hypothetical protein